jgi:hypothetical protein
MHPDDTPLLLIVAAVFAGFGGFILAFPRLGRPLAERMFWPARGRALNVIAIVYLLAGVYFCSVWAAYYFHIGY